VWGATGRDSRGHVWVGVSAAGVSNPSAHLLEYVPEDDQVIDRGDVVSQLKAARVYRHGEGQMKIHSRIVQAIDGHLYFASMDEEGESEDGSRLPTWGSHLWRLRLPDNRWEHLLAAPEGLIAAAAGGEYVYALGLFDHVLYQYHVPTGQVRSVTVGSVEGHISRNFLADHRGHAYVPRLWKQGKTVAAALVEFDTALREVEMTPLTNYVHPPLQQDHGIIAVQQLRDRSLVFGTHKGFLYRIRPRDTGPAEVTALGWFYPQEPAYVASLFTYDGERHLLGLSMNTLKGTAPYRWVVYDLDTQTSRATPMEFPTGPGPSLEKWLLYGSMTRDDRGDFYLGGMVERDRQPGPVFVRLRPSQAP
jgi:hypothetical protein